jgi:hypothetical protein
MKHLLLTGSPAGSCDLRPEKNSTALFRGECQSFLDNLITYFGIVGASNDLSLSWLSEGQTNAECYQRFASIVRSWPSE